MFVHVNVFSSELVFSRNRTIRYGFKWELLMYLRMFVVMLKAVSKLKWKLAHYGTRRFHCLNQSNTNKNYFYSLTIIGPNRSMRLCFVCILSCGFAFLLAWRGVMLIWCAWFKSRYLICAALLPVSFVFLVYFKVMLIWHAPFKSRCCMVNICLYFVCHG